ncbi:MAG: cytidylate kinase family protein, partial [Desulfatibacillaceae bacterium]|nr:cytidylate kinase family protein [Desulfatibacillaceae bacterium]
MKVVTIARLFGAGGHTIGEKVAKRLGFELVEEEMINIVARKTKVSPEWVQSVESERGNWLMNFLGTIVSPSFLERLAEEEGQGYIDEDIYKETL